MDGIQNLSTYVLGVIGVILLPGPNSLYCLSVAAQYGARQALQVMLAILLGDAILISLTVLGAATLLRQHPHLFNIIKTLGAVYLIYLAWHLFRAAALAWRNRRSSQRPLKLQPQNNHFRQGLILSLSNPKAILFFLSFFTQFVRPDAPQPLFSFLILALILQSISATYLTMLAFSGQKLAQHLGRKQWFNALCMAAVACLFLYFAFSLIRAST